MTVFGFTEAGYVIAGYASTAIVLGAYVMRVLTRGRSLSKRVPPDKRRWM